MSIGALDRGLLPVACEHCGTEKRFPGALCSKCGRFGQAAERKADPAIVDALASSIGPERANWLVNGRGFKELPDFVWDNARDGLCSVDPCPAGWSFTLTILGNAVAAEVKLRDSGSGSKSEDAGTAAEAVGPQSGDAESGASPKGQQQ